jgi:hypothetical protein
MTMMTSQLLRKVSAIGTLALFASIAIIPKAMAQSYRNITLVNNNNQQIVAGYIKTPESRNWSYAFDITEWFERNTSKNININTSQCIYDIKVVYISGSFDYGRYDTCKGKSLTYVGNGGDYSPSGVYRGAKGCQYTPTYGVPGSVPQGC